MRLRQATVACDRERRGRPAFDSQTRSRSADAVSPEQEYTPRAQRAVLAYCSRELLASLGDDPLDRIFATVIAWRDARRYGNVVLSCVRPVWIVGSCTQGSFRPRVGGGYCRAPGLCALQAAGRVGFQHYDAVVPLPVAVLGASSSLVE